MPRPPRGGPWQPNWTIAARKAASLPAADGVGKKSLKNSLINFERFGNAPANEIPSLARRCSELTRIRSGLDR
eukprot:6213949-Pleurochrysis_carterae.AAC.1